MFRPRLALTIVPTLLLAATTVAPTANAAPTAYAGPLCFGQRPTIVVGENEDGVGTPGDDVIWSRPWNSVRGLGGDDLVCGSLSVRGGPGDDRIEFVGGAEFEVADLRGGKGDDLIRAWSSQPGTTARGGTGDDRLVGGAGPQTLVGGRGHDEARGGRGHDVCVSVEATVSCDD